MEYIDSSFADYGLESENKHKKSIPDSGGIDKNTFNKLFGFVLGNTKLQAHLYKEGEKPEQKSGDTALSSENRRGRYLKNKKKGIYNIEY